MRWDGNVTVARRSPPRMKILRAWILADATRRVVSARGLRPGLLKDQVADFVEARERDAGAAVRRDDERRVRAAIRIDDELRRRRREQREIRGADGEASARGVGRRDAEERLAGRLAGVV